RTSSDADATACQSPVASAACATSRWLRSSYAIGSSGAMPPFFARAQYARASWLKGLRWSTCSAFWRTAGQSPARAASWTPASRDPRSRLKGSTPPAAILGSKYSKRHLSHFTIVMLAVGAALYVAFAGHAGTYAVAPPATELTRQDGALSNGAQTEEAGALRE